jgi:uncharacterized protein (DUF433 family)
LRSGNDGDAISGKVSPWLSPASPQIRSRWAGCIGGLRIPVATVVAMVADRMTRNDILAAYPDLESEDVDEALRYAAEAVRERELPLTVP